MSLPPTIEARVTSALTAWSLASGVVLVEAGDAIAIPGTDQYFPFQAHPEFRYLASCEIESGVVAIDTVSGDHRVFVPQPDVDDRVWHSAETPAGAPLDELNAWVDARTAEPPLRLGATTSPALELRQVLDELRVRKDDAELDAMRRAAAATAAGFGALETKTAPGLTEHQLRAVIDGAFCFNGADRPAYDSIVASGPNAAVLHFTPGPRQLSAGEFLLVDAGARVDGYACDVTRSWAVESASSQHSAIWHCVIEAQQLAVERCVVGAEYRDIHLATARDMAGSLVDLGLLRGDPADLVMRGAMAVFFPHGVGHLIGLNVHDVAGYGPGREHTDVGGTRFLRTDRVLEAGVVVTIEPGIYFIDALLDDGGLRERHADDIVWSEVDHFRGIGGVRIEDTVHVAADGPEVLSGAIAKRLVV